MLTGLLKVPLPYYNSFFHNKLNRLIILNFFAIFLAAYTSITERGLKCCVAIYLKRLQKKRGRVHLHQ